MFIIKKYFNCAFRYLDMSSFGISTSQSLVQLKWCVVAFEPRSSWANPFLLTPVRPVLIGSEVSLLIGCAGSWLRIGCCWAESWPLIGWLEGKLPCWLGGKEGGTGPFWKLGLIFGGGAETPCSWWLYWVGAKLEGGAAPRGDWS